MLNPSTIDIVKSTAPLIAETGPKLTTHFYQRMFSHHPELNDIFNLTHQDSGRQREALFNAIYGYAANIDNIEALLPAVEKIAQKHTSFNITPAQYQIVGAHLIATLDELFSPGQAVLDAWEEAYGLLAKVFIEREEAIYSETEHKQGGWRGTREFRLMTKQKESEAITSFTFEPIDGQSVVDYQPGQYLAIYLNPAQFDNQEIRQYSLSDAPNGRSYRISVKKESSGRVSTYLHDELKVGDIVRLAPPCGDFFFTSKKTTPVTLISAGVGITPMLSMLETIKTNHQAPIHWLHATDSAQQHSFKQHVASLEATHPQLTTHTWYRDTNTDNALPGLMDLKQIESSIAWHASDFYMCGPVGFMQAIAKQLLDAGVNQEQIHYECFGPHKVL